MKEILAVAIALGLSSPLLGESELLVDPSASAGSVKSGIMGMNQLGYMNKRNKPTSGPGSEKARIVFNTGYGIWDPDRDAPDPEMVALSKRAGIKVSRYPGGCETHYFDWKRVIGKPESRPDQKFGLPEFMRYCEATSTAPVITLADYFGCASDAAELVEYLNSPADDAHPWAKRRAEDGHPAPYGVVYFEYGNETYHGNHRKGGEARCFNGREYATRYLEYQKAMKSVDPSIKLGAVFNYGEWNEAVVEIAGASLDYVNPHVYIGSINDETALKRSPEEVFGTVLTGIGEVSKRLEMYRAELKGYGVGRPVPMSITEFNCGMTNSKPAPYRLSLGGALIVSEMLRQFLYDPDVFAACYWQYANEFWGMLRGYGDKIEKRPAYLVYSMFGKYLHDELLTPRISSPELRSEGGFGTPRAGAANSKDGGASGSLLPPGAWEFIGDADFQKHVEQRKLPDGVLEVDFKDSINLDFFHSQRKIHGIDPIFGYELKAEIRTEGMENSTGAGLQIGDARGWNATHSAKGSKRIFAKDWTPISVVYTPLVDTKDLIVIARRGGGGEGKLFVRNVDVSIAMPYDIGPARLLEATVSKSKDGANVGIVAINKSMDKAEPLTIRIPGAKKMISSETLWAPSVAATNEDSPDAVSIKPLRADLESGVLRVSLPPHSLSGFEIELAR